MLHWDDLKYFLAVARHGSTIAAGKALAVNQSTVHRRLNELEQRLERKLVRRETTGYRLTDYAKELLPFAERVEAAVIELERHVTDEVRNLTGVIRVTCPEPVVRILTNSALFERFYARYPALHIEFVASDRYVDLSKGEADVAFRSGDTDDELVGRKVAESLWAVYASTAFLEQFGKPATIEDIANFPIVAFAESLGAHRSLVWLKEIAPEANIAARNTSVLGLMATIKTGIGIGVLPKAVGDAEPDLVNLLGTIPDLTRDWRLLAHPDLRHTPRVAALFDFVIEEKALLGKILSG
jgi:DNA-binding transcriptional LysR family regulator